MVPDNIDKKVSDASAGDDPQTGLFAFLRKLSRRVDALYERLSAHRKWQIAGALLAGTATLLGIFTALQGLIGKIAPSIVYVSLYDNQVYGTVYKDGYYIDMLLYNDGGGEVESVRYAVFAVDGDGQMQLLAETAEPLWMDGHGQERPKIQLPDITQPPARVVSCVWHDDSIFGFPYVIGQASGEDQGTGEFIYKLDRRPVTGTMRGEPPDCQALARSALR